MANTNLSLFGVLNLAQDLIDPTAYSFISMALCPVSFLRNEDKQDIMIETKLIEESQQP